jgi:choloylglycine hydrolase
MKRVVISLLIVLMTATSSLACTFFVFKNDVGNHFAGRTLEWPGVPPAEVAVIPRGHILGDVTAKYWFVGMHHHGMFTDGINEHGLLVNALWLEESEYGGKQGKDTKITDAAKYMLGNAKTVEEAVKYLKDTKFYTFRSEVASGIYVKFHFAITQPDGKSAVVEYVGGQVHVYDNKVKVLTNDPTFDKQLEEWKKRSPSELSEENFAAFDYSPGGRFMKIAAFHASQASIPTDDAAVSRAWSMINTVDIPQGALYWRFVNDMPQTTSFSTVADLKNLNYYFRTFDNYDIRKIDLKKIDFTTVNYSSVNIFQGADYDEFRFTE